MDREKTRPHGERIRGIRQREKEAEKRFWSYVEGTGLERLSDGRFRMRDDKGNMREDKG